jgi:hypothetical protein
VAPEIFLRAVAAQVALHKDATHGDFIEAAAANIALSVCAVIFPLSVLGILIF